MRTKEAENNLKRQITKINVHTCWQRHPWLYPDKYCIHRTCSRPPHHSFPWRRRWPLPQGRRTWVCHCSYTLLSVIKRQKLGKTLNWSIHTMTLLYWILSKTLNVFLKHYFLWFFWKYAAIHKTEVFTFYSAYACVFAIIGNLDNGLLDPKSTPRVLTADATRLYTAPCNKQK